MFGNCGTCQAFARAPDEVRKIPGMEGAGVCCWRPPVAVPIQVQGKRSPGNPQGVALAAQGIRPPVSEGEGCGQWEAKSASSLQ